jgi:hypothetical protein
MNGVTHSRRKLQLGVKLLLLGLFLYGTNQGLMARMMAIGLQPGLAVFAGIWLVSMLALVTIAFNPQRRIRLLWTS